MLVFCSVYNQRLQAVPLSSRNCVHQVCYWFIWINFILQIAVSILLQETPGIRLFFKLHFNLAETCRVWFNGFLFLNIQNVAVNKFVRERILQRIQPWIQRELHAILGDLDPSIIVHVASSLFIASLEGKFNHPSRLLGVKHDFLAPLRPFLHDQTTMFWHELRYINYLIKASWKLIDMASSCEIYIFLFVVHHVSWSL